MTPEPPPPGTWRLLLKFALGGVGLVLLTCAATATALLLALNSDVKAITRYARKPIANKAVAPTEVKAMREHTDPASSSPIVLQMR